MKFSTFIRLYEEAKRANFEMFVAERGWQSWMDPYDPNEIVDILSRIYHLANTPVDEIRKENGWSRPAMSRMYHIPVRTLESWAAGKRETQPYVDALLAYALFNEGQEEQEDEDE